RGPRPPCPCPSFPSVLCPSAPLWPWSILPQRPHRSDPARRPCIDGGGVGTPSPMKAHGKAKEEIEAVGGDPNVDDTEGKPSEDRWFGGGSHGWFDRLFKRHRGGMTRP